MQLKVNERQSGNKTEAKKLRREGQIPAVLYAKGHKNHNLSILESDFSTALRNSEKGRLPTTVFTLVGSDGKKRRAIVKEIQYDVTSYKVIHLDFEELEDQVPVNVKVPIEFTGVTDCVGVKMGGVIRQVIRHLKVRCLPKQIPTSFKLDVEKLDVGQSRRLKELSIPEGVRPLVALNEVAVVIAKR